jgi:hypothetical protein
MKNASPKGNFAPGHASDAREQALILLYEAESRSMLVSDVVREQVVVPHSAAVALALGVEEAQVTYDEMISSRAKGATRVGGVVGLSDAIKAASGKTFSALAEPPRTASVRMTTWLGLPAASAMIRSTLPSRRPSGSTTF